MEEGHIEGRADRVIRKMLADGEVDKVMEIITGLTGDKGDKHDVSIGFRTALIAQGFEAEALKLACIEVLFMSDGFVMQFTPGDDGEWLDHQTPEAKQAFNTACVWVLRAGNMDCHLTDNGHIGCRGPIIATNEEQMEQLVGQFRAEIDEQFPDTPPTRQGTWW